MANGEELWEVKIWDDLRDEDLQLVADFFNQNFPGVFYPSSSPDLWKWKLGSSNPAGMGFLTVAFLGEKVVGTTSGTRQRIRLGGELIDAMEIGDTFTHPDFRKRGHCKSNYPHTVDENDYLNKSIFGRLVTETLDRASKAGVEYVFGTPNLNSKPPYLAKLGFSEIGIGRIRSWNSLTSRYAHNSKVGSLGTVSIKFLHYISRVVSSPARRKIGITEKPFETMASSLASRVPDSLPSSYSQGSFSFDVNLNFYEHRYFRHPSHKYRYFEIEREGNPIGWIICTQIKRPSGRETLVVSDWIAFDRSFSTNLPIITSMVSSKFPEIEIVSLWLSNRRVQKFHWICMGFFSLKEVSVIERSLNRVNRRTALDFEDFRIGWSDNG